MSTTRALEKTEIKKLFDSVSGKYTQRNRTMLVSGISIALRATELCQLNIGDVQKNNGEMKTYIIIRPETAKFDKERTIRIGVKIKDALGEFLALKQEIGESLVHDAPLFVSQKGGCMTRQQL